MELKMKSLKARDVTIVPIYLRSHFPLKEKGTSLFLLYVPYGMLFNELTMNKMESFFFSCSNK